MDIHQLGVGIEESTVISEGGVIAENGSESRNWNREAVARYRAKNRAKINERAKLASRAKRLDPILGEIERKTQTAWRERNRERLRANYKAYHAANKEKRKEQSARSRANRSPEQIQIAKDKAKAYRLANLEKTKADMAAWVAANKEHLKQKYKEYLPRRLALRKIRRANDPIQRLKDACRTRVGFILRKAGVEKFNHTFELVGCTPDFFKAFLTAQFKPGMSWDNFGTWEIDHRVPLAAHDLSDREQLLKAFHYSNCQPLWKTENRMKSDSLPTV